jgi:hypothetical protein
LLPGTGSVLQVDYHSFEGILYTTPVLGWFMEHVFRSTISALIQGTAELGAATWPPLEAWLKASLPEGPRKVEGLKAWAARVWWRQARMTRQFRIPAPYDPRK